MLATLELPLSLTVSRERARMPELLRTASGLPTKPYASVFSFGQVADVATSSAPTPARPKTMAERLFDAVADAKVWSSKVAMHLERNRRDGLFAQLDLLHEAEEWVDGDTPIAIESFKSFVRAILFHAVNNRPALALMPNGNVLALWQNGRDKLTVEFLPNNRARWAIQNDTDDGPERASGTTMLERLRAVVQPYGAERWFDGC